MIQINWKPDTRMLRQFGMICLLGFSGVAGVMYWRLDSHVLPIALSVIGAVSFLLSLIHPPLVKPLYIGLSVLTWPIGVVVSYVLLAILYYLVITPTGLVFRLIGRDALERKFDRDATSYWQKRPAAKPAASYYRQF